MVGLVDEHGTPIKKPWTVATTSPSLAFRLDPLSCPGPEEHPHHRQCAGKITKMTEGYTDELTDIIHEAIRDEALLSRATRAMTVIRDRVDEHDEAVEEMGNLPEPNGHRQKNGSPDSGAPSSSKHSALEIR